MQDIAKKMGTVAIAAVLLFCSLFPVTTGNQAFDRLRIQRAEAVAPAVPIIVGTALAACGLCVGGYTLSEYDGNLGQVTGDFLDYCAEAKGTTREAVETVFNEALGTDGSINMDMIEDYGYLSLVNPFAGTLLAQGLAIQAVSTALSNSGFISFDGKKFKTVAAQPDWYVSKDDRTWNDVAYIYKQHYSDYDQMSAAYGPITKIDTSYTNTQIESNSGRVVVNVGGTYDGNVSSYGPSVSARIGKSWVTEISMNASYVWPTVVNQKQVELGTENDYAATVSPELAAGTAATPTGKVNVFEPTAEQLQAGYSQADVVQAINSGVIEAENILDFLTLNFPVFGQISATISGILQGVNTLAANFADVLASPISWLAEWWATLTGWWTELLDWLGDSTFDGVMGTVIDGINDIPGTIGHLRDEVVAGVLGIPGAIGGVFEDVIEGVIALPGTLAGVMDGVIEAVQTGALEIVGAFEGITWPEFKWPELPKFDEPVSIPAPPVFGNAPQGVDLEGMLKEKAPFAYVIAMKEAFVHASDGAGANASFVADLDFDFTIPGLVEGFDGLHLDAEPWLLYQYNGMTVAGIIRTGFTMVLCAAFVVGSIHWVRKAE